MATFDRIRSGIPEMDNALDNLRIGDKVIWRVSNLEHFRLFVQPFVEQALRDGRNIVYIRFARHAPVVFDREKVKVVEIPVTERFEHFTVAIHEAILREPPETIFVFDCLSELQTAWATDLMMSNFFTLIGGDLDERNSVSYFPIRHGLHSFETIARIRDNAQVFLDIFSDDTLLFVRPLKVWNRDSATMFLPHYFDPELELFQPVLSGVQASRFYTIMNSQLKETAELNMDSCDRFYQKFELLWQNGIDISNACTVMCKYMLTRDPHLQQLVKENFQPEDYFEIHSRMIGSGLIGGKACGMLVARKLIQNYAPDIYSRLEPHDSFYVGSDVFYSYLVENGLWDLRLEQRSEEGYFSAAEKMAAGFQRGSFSPQMEEQFKRVLNYYGKDPCIVRSSSILEDGYGNAFAGKYESVFCSNSGTIEERLAEFENAIRIVYASSMSKAALDYRKRRGLDKRDEQMALLVQRVSGSRYGHHFLPSAAGVGYSKSPYHFGDPEQDRSGMLRLVMGLGTAAVDRETGSYPRIVFCQDPEKKISATAAESHQYSQQVIDAVNTETGEVDGRNLSWALSRLPEFQIRTLLSHDYDAESMFRDRGQNRKVYYVSCDGIVKNRALMDDMKRILEVIMEKYENPVDIEYTINLSESGEYLIDLLQCRPLQVTHDSGAVAVPEHLPEDQIFLESVHSSMGMSRARKLDYLVYVDAIAYYNMPYKEKYNVRDVIHAVNWACRGQGKKLMLIAPGRICTSSPELGVPTTFADISEFDILCEAAETRAGYMPELSYGSHIFQDLVEAKILYTAIFGDEKTLRFDLSRFDELPNKITDFVPDAGTLSDIVKIYDLSARDCRVYYDFLTERFLGTLLLTL